MREAWETLVGRVDFITATLEKSEIERRWNALDPRNTLGWTGFLVDTNAQVCLAWLIHECVYWAGIGLHGLNETLNNTKAGFTDRLALTAAKKLVGASIPSIIRVLKTYGKVAMDLVFLNLPFKLPFDEAHCVAFMNDNIDALASLDQYESHLKNLKSKAAQIYAFHKPGETISEKIPLEFGKIIPQEFMQLFPELREAYEKLVTAAKSRNITPDTKKPDQPALEIVGKAVPMEARPLKKMADGTNTVVKETTDTNGVTTKETTVTQISNGKVVSTTKTTETVRRI